MDNLSHEKTQSTTDDLRSSSHEKAGIGNGQVRDANPEEIAANAKDEKMNRPLILDHWTCRMKHCMIKQRAIEYIVGLIVVILILIAAYLVSSCSDISALDVNLGGQTNPNTGSTRVTIGTRFEFGNKAKKLPNFAKDK